MPVQIQLGAPYSTTSQSNVLTNQFSSPFQTDGSDEISLASIQFFNSVFNIRAAFGNNTFSVTYAGTPYAAVIPDGFYDIPALNGWFTTVFLTANNLYVLAADGSQYFFQSLQANKTYYCATYTSLPLTLPTGGSNPKALTLNNLTPLFVVNTTGFSTLLGFNQGTYPSVGQATQYMVNSQLIAQLNSQYQYNLCCSWVNQVQFNPQIPSSIFPFSPGAGSPPVSIGQQGSIYPANQLYYPILPNLGGYTGITVSIVDQVGAPIQIDPQWSVVLSVRKQQR
jgi:hypothetical protein